MLFVFKLYTSSMSRKDGSVAAENVKNQNIELKYEKH